MMKTKIILSLLASVPLVASAMERPLGNATNLDQGAITEDLAAAAEDSSMDLEMGALETYLSSDLTIDDETLRRNPPGPGRPGGPPGRVGPRRGPPPGPGGGPGRGGPRGPGHAGPRPGHGPGGAYAHHHPRPPAWRWHRNWYPAWWVSAPIYPLWRWALNVSAGEYQCIAVNRYGEEFYGWGLSVHDAAHSALFACGGNRYMNYGCFIPRYYCQIR